MVLILLTLALDVWFWSVGQGLAQRCALFLEGKYKQCGKAVTLNSFCAFFSESF